MKRTAPILVPLVVLALAGVAGAQSAPNELLDALVQGLTPVLLDLLLAGGVLLLGLVGNLTSRYIAQVKNDTFRKALATLDELANAKVLELYQEAVGELKAAAADGRLTLEEARAAADTALDELTDTLPRWLVDTLTGMAGATLDEVQEKYLLPAIEKAVSGTHVVTAARSVVDTNADPVKLEERLAAARARIGLAR